MKIPSWKVLGAGAVLLGATVSGAAARVALPCADYITTSLADGPDVGYLIGTSSRSDHIKYGGSVAVASAEGTSIETWEVGYYQMSNGRRLRIDCRNYTLDA
jgi:hypothetical protein